LYLVPCPLCGEFQILILKSHDINYGLTFSTEIDKITKEKILVPDTVRYICQYCKKEFHESKKQDMLIKGEWRPTAPQKDREKVSYNINSLYSPTVLLSWQRICQAFVDTGYGTDILKFKDFTINYMGQPWRNTKKALAWEKLMANAENYCYGEVPKGKLEKLDELFIYRGPLILVAAADVHKDRIELHVLGFGAGLAVWSIDYQIFYGNTAQAHDMSWQRV